MNAEIVRLTARQLVSRRRSLLVLGFALLPVAVAVLYATTASDQTDRDKLEFSVGVLRALVILVLLPIVALVFATAAMGSEIEDGTAVYLLAKPISRASIVTSKWVVAFAVTAALVVISTVPTALIPVEGSDTRDVTLGFAVAGVVGALMYSGLFIALSILTSRALIVGLVYVFLWEAVVTNLFQGLRVFSVREYTLGVAGAIADVPPSIWEPNLGATAAILGGAVLLAISAFVAIDRLRSFEFGETV